MKISAIEKEYNKFEYSQPPIEKPDETENMIRID